MDWPKTQSGHDDPPPIRAHDLVAPPVIYPFAWRVDMYRVLNNALGAAIVRAAFRAFKHDNAPIEDEHALARRIDGPLTNAFWAALDDAGVTLEAREDVG